MSYCPNCGERRIEGAKFCTNCGAPVRAAETPDPPKIEYAAPLPGDYSIPGEGRAAPGGYASPAGTAGQSGGGKAGKIVGIVLGVIAALVVLVLALVFVFRARTAPGGEPAPELSAVPAAPPTAEPAQETTGGSLSGDMAANEEEPESVSPPGETPAEVDDAPDYEAELQALYGEYAAILDEVRELTDSDFAAAYNTGTAYDYDGDCYPELAVLYSPDGVELRALLARRAADGAVQRQERLLCYLVGGAAGGVYFGFLEGDPVFHLVYTNAEEMIQIGEDTVISLAAQDYRVLYELSWREDPENDYGEYYVDGAEDDDLFDQVFNSLEYWEAGWPDEESLPLDEVLDMEYFLP